MMPRDNAKTVEPAGLYIHVPFCERKCPYCDFYSIAGASALLPRYVDALEREMEQTAVHRLEFDTLYIGGGTPSLLNPESLKSLLRAAHKVYGLRPDAEITIEINPGVLPPRRFDIFRSLGFNRISIGVQSFREANLKFLGRIHSAGEAVDAIDRARRARFENVGIDLIYGLPGQARQAWAQDLEKAVSLAPEHISCYGLTFAAGTRMEEDLRAGKIEPPKDDQVAEMYLTAVEMLESGGYRQYEVSNFSRGNHHRSRHNLKYWNGAPYLGLGPSAHSYIRNQRCWNVSDVFQYVERLEQGGAAVETCETLEEEQEMIEAIYLGLRQTAGIEIGRFDRRFNVRFKKLFGNLLQAFAENDLLACGRDRCRLTPRGMLLLDSVVAEFVGRI